MNRILMLFQGYRALVFVLIGALSLATTAGSSAATVEEVLKKIQGLAPAQKKALLEEGARKEGQVVVYTSMSLSDYPKLNAAFEAAHPYLKINTFRSTPSGVFTKLDTEAKAGRFAADVIGSGAVEMWQLKQKNYSAPYLSHEAKAYPAGAYDRDGYWTAYEVTPIVLAFNPKLVSSADIPKNYADLLDPKWRGKMSLGTDEYDWFDVMLDGMGKAKGLEYMKALAKQQLHMPGSSSVMRVQLMMAGESAIAIAARGRRVVEFKEKGAPIDFRLFEPYPGVPNALALTRRAPHPYAAALYIDWLLSEEVQTFMAQKIPRMSLRKGVKQLQRNQALFEKDFVFVNPARLGPDLNEIMATFNEVFGIHRNR